MSETEHLSSPLMDALLAAERAVFGIPCGADELNIAEEFLHKLLAEVLMRLGKPMLVPQVSAAAPTPPRRSRELQQNSDNSPDALDEWYTGGGSVSRKTKSGSFGSPDLQNVSRNMAQTFSLEQGDDVPTEIADAFKGDLGDIDGCAGSLEDIPGSDMVGWDRTRDPHWQYGKFVVAKLVTMSPPGCTAFEQLLNVMMKVFELTERQKQKAQEARPKSRRWWAG